MWEAVALSMNIEPRSVNIDPTRVNVTEFVFGESTDFADRLLVLARNLTAGSLRARSQNMVIPARCTVALGDFAVWAHSLGWDMPWELRNMATRGNQDESEKQVNPEKNDAKTNPKAKVETSANVETSLGTRERNNVARIIGVLAIEAKIDLGEVHKSAKAIEVLTEQCGVRVSDDTIAQWLKRAVEQLGKLSK